MREKIFSFFISMPTSLLLLSVWFIIIFLYSAKFNLKFSYFCIFKFQTWRSNRTQTIVRNSNKFIYQFRYEIPIYSILDELKNKSLAFNTFLFDLPRWGHWLKTNRLYYVEIEFLVLLPNIQTNVVMIVARTLAMSAVDTGNLLHTYAMK